MRSDAMARSNLRFILLLIAIGLRSASAGEPPASSELDDLVGQPVTGNTDRFGHPLPVWRKAEIEMEWGFKHGTEQLPFDGSIAATQTGVLGRARPLSGDQCTVMTGDLTWTSPPSDGARRGIVVPVLLTDAVRGPGRTIITVRAASGSFSFQPIDLRRGPILVSELGFFIRSLSPLVIEPSPVAARPAILTTKNLLEDKLDVGGRHPGWGKDTPVVYANPADEPLRLLDGAIMVPPRTVVVHPGADRDVAVGWQSPMTGKVGLRAKVVHGHPGGGDGISWRLVRESGSNREELAQGEIDRDGSQSIPAGPDAGKLAGLSVQQGDGLSLVIGRRGNHFCDTTFVELVITEVGGAGRRWDLAKEVVDDIQRANPHADSLGNPGVWHFLAPAGPTRLPTPQVVRMSLPFDSKATTAREYLDELARHNPKTIRQRVREHPEQTLENAVRSLYGATQLPSIPEPPFPPAMSVEVPDKYLTGLWRNGAWRIIQRCPRIHRDDLPKVLDAGDVTNDCRRVDAKDSQGMYVVRDHPFPPLGCETDRILWALDHLGMHDVARDGISVWLEGQQKDGALTLNSGIERAHGIGALQVLWVMAEHYRLTGDRQWLERELPRLRAAADWILRRRRVTMKKDLTPQELARIEGGTFSPYGLQPKVSMGDGDPSGSRYYYWADSAGYQSVKLLAEAIAELDPALGAQYAAEAAKYQGDILPVLDESIVLSPVVLVRDGTYRSFLPQGFQDRGPLALALPEQANIYSHCGPYHADYVITSAAIEAWLRAGVLSVEDPRVDSHFDVLEDVFFWDHPWFRKRKPDYDPERDWFNFGWAYQSGWERLPDYYLRKDDVPNFLRDWLNRCAVDIHLPDWSFNEHTTFAENDKSHGYAVFLSNFRNMLVMEIDQELWLARATPRAWLEQGKKVSVKNAPTHFGRVAYEVASDVDRGKINAMVELPSRKAPKNVILRFRHPKAVPIQSVTVNGKEWQDFNQDSETIELQGLSGPVAVTARY